LPAGEAECLAGVAAVVRAGEHGPEVSALCLFMQVLPVLARRTPLTRGAACSRDGLLSLGPALVTPKDIAEGEHSPLAIELLVDQAMQSGIWSPDIRSIRSAVAAAHEEVGLCTGDILLVGGLGSDAIGSQPVRIKAGDRVTIRSPLGIQERRCDAPKQLN
jgi:2-keto-4-pentenoate hydratase/2-oxohepta-3-ene-1,7-dioic acid hydratase in catechol pathway